MMQPLILFGGLICIPMYGYNWVMTIAQLELIGNDKPLSLFKRNKQKNGNPRTPSANSVLKAVEKYNKKTLEDLAFNPNEYLNTK